MPVTRKTGGQLGALEVTEWTLDEFTNAFDMTAKLPANQYLRADRDRCVETGRIPGWYGDITTRTDATKLLSNGWQAGAERLLSLTNDIAPPQATSRKRRLTWSDSGDEVDPDRALLGQWDTCWRVAKRVSTRGPVVIDLYVQLGGSCANSADQLFWQGATAVAVCDLLEQAGYQCRLIGYMMAEANGGGGRSGGGRDDFKCDIVVKESSEPLRIDAVAAALCHAGVFRTHGFWAMACGSALKFGTNYATWTFDYFRNGQRETVLEKAGETGPDKVYIRQTRDLPAAKAEVARILGTISEGM